VLPAKRFCFALLLLLQVLLLLVDVRVGILGWYFAVAYLLVLVQAPAVYIWVLLKKAHLPEHYHKVSSLIKWVMLSGILSMIFFKIYH
jgi:4-hydroxybenzoate polyprenyltransferase